MFSGLEGLVCRSSCGSQTVRVGPAEALACPPTVRAEPVAAWALLLRPFGLSLSKPWRAGWKSMLGFRAGAGLSPRQATHFSLLRQRKVSKRKATPSLRPLRCAPGQTCVGAVAGCAVELALLLRSAARTTTASQSTKHARSDARATPQPPRRRRSQQGVGSRTAENPNSQTAKQPNSQTAKQPNSQTAKQPNSQTAKQPNSHSGLCFARPPLAGASATRCAGGAERSDGPCGCPIRGSPSVCAWGAQGAGWRVCRRTHALRELTHRSCSSAAPQARSEFCGAPRDRAPQVAP